MSWDPWDYYPPWGGMIYDDPYWDYYRNRRPYRGYPRVYDPYRYGRGYGRHRYRYGGGYPYGDYWPGYWYGDYW
ncbi:unnamed protein product [Rotaria sp. Silwood1]|nr:unnamed protein product [Rotaria sp. Silwood1]CAF4893128.1 unnamed protein product [Rotaria sp. Silwood1]